MIKNDTPSRKSIYDLGIFEQNQTIRLHLGCGENHLDGYVNIDFPQSSHSVQENSGADYFVNFLN